jgi:hypothetical protein
LNTDPKLQRGELGGHSAERSGSVIPRRAQYHDWGSKIDQERQTVDEGGDGILNAACDGSRENPPSERHINQVLAAVTGIGAKDEIEGMLATQMVATHTAIITTLRRQKDSEMLLEQERYGNLAVKLLRTFAAQIEALQRYRGKGQQHIRVEHVDVHAGGQAIVGAVTAGEGGKEKSGEQVLAPSEITHEPSTPMWSQDPEREAVPVSGGARKAPM